MNQKTQFNSSILDQVIGQKLNQLIAPQKPKGLLGFIGSQYAQDLGTGLLGQAGFQPMPTSLGQSIGTAFQNANQLRNQRRMADFSELGALANIRSSLQSDTTDTDDSDWELFQAYAAERDINLSESQARQIERLVGKGNVGKLTENTGTFVNTLDRLLEPYKDKNKKEEKDTISLETGEDELKQENINKKVKVIQDDFNKNNWNEIIFAANEVEKLIKDSKESGNIEGVGFIEGKLLPNFLVGEEGKLNKAKIARLFNLTLKDRSGAAVTEPELLRLQEEFGKGSFTTDQDFINAFNNYKRIFNNILKQEIKGYDPKAFSAWGGTFQIGDTTKEDQRERFL